MINKLLFTALLFVFTSKVISQVPSYVPTSGLVGYWPFNGNANDESGNGNDGTVSGATLTNDRFGVVDKAYSFDGIDDRIFINNSIFDNGSNFTFSGWYFLNTNINPNNGNNSHIILNTSPHNGLGLAMNWGSSNKYSLSLGSGTPSISWNILFDAQSGQNIEVQSWKFITLVKLSNTYSLYVDGVLDQIWTANNSVQTYLYKLYFGGCDPLNSNEVINGKLDNISIWNRALTQQEITNLYTSTVPVSCLPAYVPTSGLVGYWPFCGNANDESGNGNNGTVNGATLTSDRNGNSNSAYSFNNLNDVITISNPNPQLNNTSKTISTWFKLPNQYNYSSLAVVKHGTPYSTGFDLAIDQNDAAYGTNNYIVVFLAGNGGAITFTTNQSELGSWVHFTATYDGSIIKLYLNGILKTSQNFSGSLDCPNDFIYFGKWDNPSVPAVVGREMDDIGIWNRALTPAEITQLYSGTSVTTPVSCTPFLSEDQTVCAGTSVALSASVSSLACPTLPTNLQTGLVGYWPFCGNANDASGNGNNGTVNGATLTTDRFGSANAAYNFGTNSFIRTNQVLSSVANSFSYSAVVSPNANVNIPQENTQYNDLSQCVIHPTHGSCFGNWQDHAGAGLYVGQNGVVVTEHTHDYVRVSLSFSGSVASNSVVTIVYENKIPKLYLNGVLVKTGIADTRNVHPSAGFDNTNFANYSTSGFGAGFNGQHFNGKIDEILIWNYPLSLSDIQLLNSGIETTYSWSTGATTSTLNVSPTTTTTYTCTTTTNGVSCTDSVTVVVNNPTINLGNDVTVCGTSTTLTAPTGYDSYLWSNGATTNTTTVIANGTYSCIVTQGGCSVSDTIDVTLIDATITASDSVICVGDSVTLSVPQGGSSNTACAALPTNLQTGLLEYYPFCGNANSGLNNGNNGTVKGGAINFRCLRKHQCSLFI